MQVAGFAVMRRGVGRVQWEEPVDVRGLELDGLVHFSKGSVQVYLDSAAKPQVGVGLNKPAMVCSLHVGAPSSMYRSPYVHAR